MKEVFIKFFVDVAQQKLKVKYSIVKMILHTIPHIQANWKEVKQEVQPFFLDEAKEKYPSLETREYRFISFIEDGNLTDVDMRTIMDLHKTLDLKNLYREYAYTEEELRYYLKSRLISRMISKMDQAELPNEDSTSSDSDSFQVLQFNQSEG